MRTKAPVTAQKFTVDPRLLAAVQGSTTVQIDDDKDSEHGDSSDDDEDVAPKDVAPKVETKAEKLDRLVREYEEEVARSKAAAETGEGCLLCSS